MLKTIEKYIKNKKVLILGFGREGKSTYHMMQKVGGYESLTIADLNPVTYDLPENVQILVGENYQKTLNDYDLIMKSPGIVLEQDISTYTCKIASQTELFFQRFREQIVGITGTKGKSTTTTLLYHILKENQKDCILAGNIGIPAFDIAEEVTENSIVCFEMSSHQLEYMTVSPKWAVLMNIHEEHLDHYGTMEKYVAAKEKIYQNQQAGDTLICNVDILPKDGACKAKIISAGYEGSGAELIIYQDFITYENRTYHIPTEEIPLIGIHNYYDIGVAYVCAKAFGIGDEGVSQALKTYEPLPHRLQYIGTVAGVKYYDDSISTICDTTIQALTSLNDTDTVVIGGMDRGIDYGELIEFLSRHPVPHIILMEATGQRIFQEIQAGYPKFQNRERLHLVSHLEEAVNLAKQVTRAGHSCVLSPAAASYGIFKNFEARGEAFAALVHEQYH
ncbi:MAG: UDP-N-acetylmuramoyl-L-alanine--D-glutamate ligase [Lachnospiraceae bacterium]|nr:UDP-N-acetylmuramoyl-L-alanine--D-glutamate ligase [Lachnospiraceae bacterium]